VRERAENNNTTQTEIRVLLLIRSLRHFVCVIAPPPCGLFVFLFGFSSLVSLVSDTHLRDSFLMTYQSFTTPTKLLKLLRLRFAELASVPDTAVPSVLQELKRDQLRSVPHLALFVRCFVDQL
jgi:RasGEF N-terminal motif